MLRARVASLASAAARHEAAAARLRDGGRAIALPLARVHEVIARQARERLEAVRRELAALARRERCGARCRDGHACRAPANGAGRRCKLHGGRSTGPRTAEGRARALEALARVNAARAAARAAA